MIVISWDFDDTLASTIPTGWGGEYIFGIQKYVDLLTEYHALGCCCIILTARSPHEKNQKDITNFLKKHEIEHCIDRVVYTSHLPKGQFAVDNKVSLHYDDSDDHLLSVKDCGILVIDSKH